MLHSGRIGGATQWAAMGLSSWAFQSQGRWKANAVQSSYIRNNREDVENALIICSVGAGSLGERRCLTRATDKVGWRAAQTREVKIGNLLYSIYTKHN